jgi:recombinational DNA repair protein RecR
MRVYYNNWREMYAAAAKERDELKRMLKDVAPVVRCNDCRFCEKHPTSDMVKMCTNEQWNTEYYPLVHDGDFCSYGER